MGLWTGLIAVAMPWIVLSSFLLTEVVAYPAFCWALLALTHATIRKTARADLLAFAAIAVAVLARTQFLVLALAFPAAIILDAALARVALRSLVRSRPVLFGAYALALLVVLGAAVSGGMSRLLGSYSVTATGIRVDLDLLRLTAEHVAILALGLAILPYIVGVGWLIDRLRPSAPAAERAFAALGCITLALLTIQVASFNQRFGGGLVNDRYMFYAVPIVLVALAAALVSARMPRWWTLVVPASICAIGFATTTFDRYEKLNVDSPIAILNDELVRLSSSIGWTQVTLVAATVVAVLFLVVGDAFLPRLAVAAAVGILASLVLPLEAVYAFDRLFAVNGTNGLPVTLDQGGVFNWIDRNVGKKGRVTVIPYPVNPPDYWANVGYWWDVEFWNESAVHDLVNPDESGEYPAPPLRPEDGSSADIRRLDAHPLSRHRRALPHCRQADGLRPRRLPVRARPPMRAAFVTDGYYPDGWTRPHTPAEITVFAVPGKAASEALRHDQRRLSRPLRDRRPRLRPTSSAGTAPFAPRSPPTTWPRCGRPAARRRSWSKRRWSPPCTAIRPRGR